MADSQEENSQNPRIRHSKKLRSVGGPKEFLLSQNLANLDVFKVTFHFLPWPPYGKAPLNHVGFYAFKLFPES